MGAIYMLCAKGEEPSLSILKSPWESIRSFVERRGFVRRALYSNIPKGMIEDVLETALDNSGARGALLVSLHFLPEMLEEVVEKSLSPYALFLR